LLFSIKLFFFLIAARWAGLVWLAQNPTAAELNGSAGESKRYLLTSSLADSLVLSYDIYGTYPWWAHFLTPC